MRLAGQIVLVTLGTPEQSRAFLDKRAVPYLVVCDPRRAVYRAFGLERGRAGAFLSSAVARSVIRALSRGAMQGRTVGDPLQLPGTFVVNRGGTVTVAHYARHSGDHLSAADLRGILAETG